MSPAAWDRSACVPMSSACLLRLAGFGHGNGDRLLPATHLLARAAFQRALLMFVHHLVDLLLLRRCRHELSPKNCLTRKRMRGHRGSGAERGCRAAVQ